MNGEVGVGWGVTCPTVPKLAGGRGVEGDMRVRLGRQPVRRFMPASLHRRAVSSRRRGLRGSRGSRWGWGVCGRGWGVRSAVGE